MKNILITGASSGIGEEFAIQYAAPDVCLFLSGRDADRLRDVAQKCCSKGAKVEAKTIDVCDRQAMAAWVSDISNATGGLDLVIANAGISGGFGGQAIEDIVRDYRIFDVNLTGVLNTIYPALPRMVERKSGHIVIVSSMASFIPMPSAPAYSASKVAVRFYGEALAAKLKPYHVKVSIICPGFIKSRMTQVNDFPMPFLMETDEAVARMKRGIERGQLYIAFPLIMRIVLKLFQSLPSGTVRAVFAWLPDKKVLPKN